jgi:rhodanese-related sulfurtransferase
MKGKAIMKKIFALCSVSALIALSAVMTSQAAEKTDCNKESHYPLITKSELKNVAESKSATIFDVNSEESFEKSHVPGAIHFESHKTDFAQMLPKDKNAMIVAYCGGPQCTAWKMAAKEACKLGYTNVRHFKEGISGWDAKE